jgi:exodeoxyribonuclease VIII
MDMPPSGIVYDMSNAEYHKQIGYSSSAIKTVCKQSLAHYMAQKPLGDSPAFALGSAVHATLLEPERDLVFKGPKTRVSKMYKEMYANKKDDEVVLTEVEYHVHNKMCNSALDNPICNEILTHKERVTESSVFVTDPHSGLNLKTRPDLYIPETGQIFDIKTTIDASPEGFAEQVGKYAYHIQAAFYLYTCKLAGLKAKEFNFIAVEKTSPYIAHLHKVSPELMIKSIGKVKEILVQIATANLTGEYGTGWGDYSTLKVGDF